MDEIKLGRYRHFKGNEYEVIAIATGYDKKGKLNLSRKELLLKNRPKKEENTEEIKEENVDTM